ncbi:helix-turn-helix domain-containing protein [Pseudomonas rubra]|uniref:Helix-turn-helix domain-containing protein n=1 Tax=Pseudomonas rubra TaxID=2942627 RepID=A0ABT5PB36_9PSED|nr:helix-turn-helix domain-containing protein [Pseudomonas rubra]MDD1015523.1 helix-turn-helix domain-containing protein [Pseudomonas rubra]MDD1041635.1 helix-turn-helix domain-containing protein [Pseudomonas rubra]MDD1157121.1 helix-turn-helix domain-containing protein [Pseudomonas rubra]
MPGKKVTPDQGVQAAVLREAGWTVCAIAERLELSISTVQRLLKRHSVIPGASANALIEKARDEMLNAAFSLDSVRQIAASRVLDDLALTQKIRTKLAESLDALDPAGPTAFRSLAASATTLKLTQDVGRRALPLDKLAESQDIDELPELHIRFMTETDVAIMRAQQRLDDAELEGDAEAIADELETIAWLQEQDLVKPPREGARD